MVLSLPQTFSGVRDKQEAFAELYGNKRNLTMSGSARGSLATQAEGTKEEEGQLKQKEVSFSKSNIREGITSLLCTTGSTPWRYLISPLKMRSSFPRVPAHCSTMFKAFQTLSVYRFSPSFFITEVIFVPFFAGRARPCFVILWSDATQPLRVATPIGQDH